MADDTQRVLPVLIEDEMKKSYIDYSMSVIVSRALPDVRDGLKPVHRRILTAMNDLNLYHDRPYRKSAKIAGDVTGNYHPHGTVAVYDTLVRLVQDFSLRHPLVDGQGNFGSIDGDAAAAERYTEARLSEIAEEMLRDLDKETVDFRPNYDETRQEPVVLPASFPNLLVNGTSGIAVGMATNIPTHNLSEVIDACILCIDRPDCTIDDMMEHVIGPDFPTGGQILGTTGIRNCYHYGRGHIIVRAKSDVDELKSGKLAIIVSEIPYQVNKASMLEKIADLVKNGHITGISDIRDESDRDGLRVVIELRKDAQPQVVLNQLYKHTQMQTTFGANMLALKDGRPQVMNLKAIIEAFLEHRHEVIVRRSQYELEQAKKRAHILEGLLKALDHIDAIIRLIRESADVETARQGLMERFDLSEIQSNAILEMRLQRLTGLERQKIEEEYKEILARIEELESILASREKVMAIVREDLLSLKKRFHSPRRTEIVPADEGSSLHIEDLIPEEEMVITISHAGYIKRLPVTTYRAQNRGGRGLTGVKTKEEDFVEHLFVASTHTYLLLFTDKGRCYWIKVYEIPSGTRTARGRSILTLVAAAPDEKVTAYVLTKEFPDDKYLMLATRNGTVKKTPLAAFGNPRKAGIVAIDLRDNDSLIGAALTQGDDDVLLATSEGKAIRFNESDVRSMGRTAAGVRGISLSAENDAVVGMVVVQDRSMDILVVTENGYGKRTPVEDYRLQGRGGQGIINVRTSDRNGQVAAIKAVTDQDDVMVISSEGLIIRMAVAQISQLGRATQGVRLIQLGEDERVSDLAHIVREDEDEGGDGGEGDPDGDPDDGGGEGESGGDGVDTGAGAGEDGTSQNGTPGAHEA
ncbi:MAG: DNA gyrase subunit A [Candidatus Eisenbacteria bacterium]